jgi:type II secretory pathway pseudopilin PulG
MELLVVVGIVGALAAIAFPAFTSRQGKAYEVRLQHDAKTVAGGEEAYYVDFDQYFAGNCSLLPGVVLSPGVLCSIEVRGQAFTISLSHPLAPKHCTWASDSQPNLACS